MTMTIGQKRLRFDGVDVHEEEGSCRVEVRFTFAEQVIRVSETCEADHMSQMKAAAVATFKAIEEAVEGHFKCALADLDHVSALGKDLIAVLVNVEFEGKPVQVFGSCPISGREIDAAVKAALNATNRLVELAMRD